MEEKRKSRRLEKENGKENVDTKRGKKGEEKGSEAGQDWRWQGEEETGDNMKPGGGRGRDKESFQQKEKGKSESRRDRTRRLREGIFTGACRIGRMSVGAPQRPTAGSDLKITLARSF